ncbi:MAG: response regulator, partial [Planctomycetales bacterium]|nr:response regulator [Planctomycetales bacterium]
SELGKGSVFTLAIDCGEVRDSDLVTPSIAISNPGDTANPAINIAGTILVVDDRRDIRFIAQHFIEKAGGVVITACNGQEAIELLTNSASGKSVDLVVMDMQMPVMDGYTAAAELRRLGYNKPIIALTANAMKDDRLKCLECGCSDYATKPLDGGRFISLVASYLQSIRQ